MKAKQKGSEGLYGSPDNSAAQVSSYSKGQMILLNSQNLNRWLKEAEAFSGIIREYKKLSKQLRPYSMGQSILMDPMKKAAEFWGDSTGIQITQHRN
jgi:hypothetical protein